MKIVIFVSDSVYFTNLIHIFERFLTFDVLVQARPALRDRRKFFSTNNLRLVKTFLEIINEALTAKNEQITKSCISSHIFVYLCHLYTY